MWTTYVALLPAVLAVHIGMRHTVAVAFLQVYVPVLLLLPDYYLALTPGLPDPSFNQAIAVALLAVFLARGAPGYRFGITDLLVIAYSFSVSYSEYRASGFADAQNLMFTQFSSVLIPYLLAKSLIEPQGLASAFARQVVICSFVVTVLNLYENRFGVNLWQRLLGPLFPGFGEGWVTTFRFGVARAAGPYGHALLAGIVMFVAYRLQRWLHWSSYWPLRWPRWSPLPIAAMLSLSMAVGLLGTLAKGAMLAAFLAALIPLVGRSKQRALVAGVMVGVLACVGIPAVVWFLKWASVGRLHALSANQETAAYRYELVVQYLEIAHQRLWFGWGLNDWPRVANMPSIDNFYLLLYLMHGGIAGVAFVAMMLSVLIRLILKGILEPLSEPPGSALSFTLASILFGYLLVIASVYLGLQAVPLLFIILGWAESHLSRQPFQATRQNLVQPDLAAYRFRRVLV